jgi:hypothetical protein
MSLDPKAFAEAKETQTEMPIQEVAAQETKVEATNEQVAETKAEEVVTDVTKETASTEVKKESLFDKFTKPETKVEETKVPEDVAKEIESYKTELEKYKNSPLAKLLGGDYDLTQVDLKDFLKQAVGENYDNLSDAELIEKSLRTNPMFEKLSEEEQEEEISNLTSRFDSMTKLEKLEARQELLEKLNGDEENEIFKTLQEIQNNQKTLVDPDKFFEQKTKETFEQTYNNVKSALSELGNSLVGQEYNGFKVTADAAKSILDAFDNQTQKFNVEEVAFNLFKATNFDNYGKFMYEKGKMEAEIKAANPSRNETRAGIEGAKDTKGLGGMTFDDFKKIR